MITRTNISLCVYKYIFFSLDMVLDQFNFPVPLPHSSTQLTLFLTTLAQKINRTVPECSVNTNLEFATDV